VTPSTAGNQNVAVAPNFLDLPDGELQRISQEAVRLDLQRKLEKGLPIFVWNDGKPCNRYADGRIEYIEMSVI
jgi:hypothetical protein